MREEIKKSKTFIILVIIISYIFGFSVYFLRNYFALSQTFFSIFSIFYMYIPFFIVVIVEKYIYKGSLKGLGLYLKWDKFILISILFPIIVTFLSNFLSLLFKDISINSQYFKLYFMVLLVLQVIIVGSTINALVALGEEIGWRGYLVNNLIHKGFLKASFIIGFVWGIWHLPLILMGLNYPESKYIGIFMMILFTILLSPIMVYISLKSKSIINASIFHGVMNSIGGLHFILLKGGTDLTKGITGVPGLIILFILNLILLPIFLKFEKELKNIS
ncbi:MAG: CPBP family intramembrane metalloprotease [Caldisericia bacterium]|nr:CPBP family intramembrane metalloprotease [Caldisericia bacterium]